MIKRKLVLDWEEETTGKCVLGIVSSTSHLELIHALNHTGHFNFIREDDMENGTKAEPTYYIHFSYMDLENEKRFKLIKNKGLGGLNEKGLKDLDYLLLIQSEDDEVFQTTKTILQGHRFVQTLIEVDLSKLTDKTKNLLDL